MYRLMLAGSLVLNLILVFLVFSEWGSDRQLKMSDVNRDLLRRPVKYTNSDGETLRSDHAKELPDPNEDRERLFRDFQAYQLSLRNIEWRQVPIDLFGKDRFDGGEWTTESGEILLDHVFCLSLQLNREETKAIEDKI